MKKEQLKKLIREVITEQTVEGCQTAADFGGFASFEQAVAACCSKCATLTGDSDPCYNFCEERCCELCLPPANGCPEGFSWNASTCHCEHDNLNDNPCQVFSMMNIASQESTCNACDNGTANEYQSNFCDCCPEDTGGPTNSGGPIFPGKDDGGNKAPLASKSKPRWKTPKDTGKKYDWRGSMKSR